MGVFPSISIGRPKAWTRNRPLIRPSAMVGTASAQPPSTPVSTGHCVLNTRIGQSSPEGREPARQEGSRPGESGRETMARQKGNGGWRWLPGGLSNLPTPPKTKSLSSLGSSSADFRLLTRHFPLNKDLASRCIFPRRHGRQPRNPPRRRRRRALGRPAAGPPSRRPRLDPTPREIRRIS